MKITLTIQPSEDYKAETMEFDSLKEAQDYLREWEAAVEATTQLDDAVAVMNF